MTKIIALMGGRQTVCQLTDVRPNYLSQMQVQQRFPACHVRFFIAVRPELDWPALLGNDYQRFETLFHHKSIMDVRVSRLRKHKKSTMAIKNLNGGRKLKRKELPDQRHAVWSFK